MKDLIPLTDAIRRAGERLRYDPESGFLLRIASKTHPRLVNKRAGGLNSNGYRQIRILGHAILEHRLIWNMVYNENPKFIDHINGDRSDNRITNLRNVTRLENAINRGVSKLNTSGFKGVYFHKDTMKYAAQISSYGVKKHLGVFETPEEAHAAYKVAAEIHHAGFAREGL